MRAVALSLAFLALSACMGEATFDASSDAAIKESAEQISADLTEDERDEFQKAFMYFSLGGADGLANVFSAALSGEKTGGAMVATNLSSIDGLTGTQIIEKYRSARQADEEAAAARQRVRDLKKEAERFLADKKFEQAIATYEKMSEIPSGVDAAETGIAEANAEMQTFAEKMDYLEKVEITEFSARRIDTYSGKNIPATRISLKNMGDRSLDRVEVTVYFYDDEGSVIYEEDYNPVLVSDWNITGHDKPLKGGYVKEMEADKWYTLDVPLSEWQEGNAKAKVTDLKFSE